MDDVEKRVQWAMKRLRQKEIPTPGGVTLGAFLMKAPLEVVRKSWPVLTVFGCRESALAYRKRLGILSRAKWRAHVAERVRLDLQLRGK